MHELDRFPKSPARHRALGLFVAALALVLPACKGPGTVPSENAAAHEAFTGDMALDMDDFDGTSNASVGRFVEGLAAFFGSRFGGAWAEAESWSVGIVGRLESDLTKVRELASESMIDPQVVTVVDVRYSRNQLEEFHSQALQQLGATSPSSIVTVAVDDSSNQVVIATSRDPNDIRDALSGIPQDALRVEQTAGGWWGS